MFELIWSVAMGTMYVRSEVFQMDGFLFIFFFFSLSLLLFTLTILPSMSLSRLNNITKENSSKHKNKISATRKRWLYCRSRVSFEDISGHFFLLPRWVYGFLFFDDDIFLSLCVYFLCVWRVLYRLHWMVLFFRLTYQA